MIVVTRENITKLSEEALLTVLNRLSDDDPYVDLIEAELDRRADVLAEAKERSKVKKTFDVELLSKLKSEVSELFSSFQSGNMTKLIEVFGDEFSVDYTIDFTTFVITSHVNNACETSPGRWEHETEEETLRHYQRLLYHRIYDKHMRNVTVDSLSKLKLILEGIK